MHGQQQAVDKHDNITVGTGCLNRQSSDGGQTIKRDLLKRRRAFFNEVGPISSEYYYMTCRGLSFFNHRILQFTQLKFNW